MTEEFIGVLTAKRKSWSYKEFAPEGVRYTDNAEGEFKGVFDAVYFSTADVLDNWPKTREGVFMGAFYLADGDLVLVRGKSKVKMTSPTTTRGESTGTFETKSKKLAWLNGAKARIVGEGSPEGSTGKVYAER